MKTFFKKLMQRNIDPYPFQERTANFIEENKNVLLQAPTGSGKTWAALLSYLKNRYEGRRIVDRVIYVLPLRSLAVDLYQSTFTTCQNLFEVVTTHEQRTDERDEHKLCITLQTGEHQNDPFFQGDIIFTTIDQLLSAYLHIPFSVSTLLQNINQAALFGSLIIFDEIHLLDPVTSLKTVLEMIKRLSFTTQFLLMTATMPRESIELLRNHLNAELVTLDEDEISNLPSHKEKKRKYVWCNSPLIGKTILEHHDGNRTLVIVNTVQHAQKLYKELLPLVPNECSLLLLHSRFLHEDKMRIQKSIEKMFGPKAEKNNTILIATQVIEAGFDISADNLHTLLCPANALIQRAGRCARYKDRNKGTVYIYDLPKDDKGIEKFGPYRSELLRRQIYVTRALMQDHSGKILNYEDEKMIVDAVHIEDKAAIMRSLNNLSEIASKVNETINFHDKSAASELIRNIDSVGILITSDPDQTININKLPNFLSVPRYSIYQFQNIWLKDAETEILIKAPFYSEQTGNLCWQPITDERKLITSWMLAISPKIVRYTKDIGLEFGLSGEEIPITYSPLDLSKSFSYTCTSYVDHIHKVFLEKQRNQRYFSNALKRLSEMLSCPVDSVKLALDLTITFHDVGKLNVKWQKAAQTWMKDYYPEDPIYRSGKPLSHTTFCIENGDAEKLRSGGAKYDRGYHSIEGAFAVLDVLRKVFEDDNLVSAIYTAIARHHGGKGSAEIKENTTFTKDSNQCIMETLVKNNVFLLSKIELAIDKHITSKDLSEFILELDPFTYKYHLLYSFLVRYLRLSDQRSFQPSE